MAEKSSRAMNLKQLASSKGFEESTLLGFGVRDGENGECVEIPYFNQDGTPHPRFRRRFDGEKGHRWNQRSEEIVPYGLHRPIPLGDDGQLWIVEGESDCWTLWQNGISALGVPGTSMIKCLKRDHFIGVTRAYIVKEPGLAGERFPMSVASKMRGEGYTGELYAVTLPEKDPRALWLADKELFMEKLEEAALAGTLLEVIVPGETKADRRFGRLSLPEFFALAGQRTECLIEGLLPRRGIALLAARQKVGKSCIASHIAYGVMRGTEALGRRCRAGRVLYFSFDEPTETLNDRLEIMGVKGNDPMEICTITPPVEWVPWLRAWIEDYRPSLLVVDTIAKLVRPKSMDDYAEVNRVIAPLLQIRTDYPIAQLWVTHTTKPGIGTTAVLGSIAWTAAVDATIMATWDKSTDIRSLETEQRVGESVSDVQFSIDLDTNAITVSNDVYMAGQRFIEQGILSYFKDDTAVSLETLADAVGARKYLVRRASDALIDAGLLLIEGSGKTGDPRRYRALLRS